MSCFLLKLETFFATKFPKFFPKEVWYKSVKDLPDSHDCFFALTVGFSDANQQYHHCGIVLSDTDSSIKFFHLGWHAHLFLDNDLKTSDKYNSYYFILPKLSDEKKRIINSHLRQIWKRNKDKGLPYAISYDAGKFNDDGTVFLNGKYGLTCSTFVIAALRGAKVELLEYDKWPIRSVQDKEWHRHIVNTLIETKERCKISDQHIERVKNEINCARFRPEEVAASISFNLPPTTTFCKARYRGNILLNQINTHKNINL